MGLLLADLTALANLPRTAPGRRQLTSTLLGLGLLALLWWSIADTLCDNPSLLELFPGHGTGDSLRGLLGIGLLPCPIVATWLGLSMAQRQLFETPELTLWRQAPLPGWRGPVQVLLRACFVTVVWASALSLPFTGTVLAHTTAPTLPWLLLPVAILCCTVPLLCTLLAAQIVLVRFFAGRVLRFVLTIVSALASVGFTTWLLLGLFTPANTQVRAVAAAASSPDRLPWTIDTASALLRAAVNGSLATDALRATLGWLGLAVSLFWFAARLHPRAVERHLEVQAPLLQRRRRAWPTGVTTIIRRKEFAQVLQQPGALIGFLVFAVLVFALARQRVLVGSILDSRNVAPDLAQLAAMLLQWFLAVLLVLYAHMGRLALWDGEQWSLYVTSPAAHHAILRGKLQAVAVLLLWPLVLVGAAGGHFFGANTLTLLVFLGTALGGTLAALGVLAVVGTQPWLMRPDDGGQIVQGGRSFLAALLLVVLFQLALAPAWLLWPRWIENVRGTGSLRAAAPWFIGAAWLLGATVALLGTSIAAYNYRKLTSPR